MTMSDKGRCSGAILAPERHDQARQIGAEREHQTQDSGKTDLEGLTADTRVEVGISGTTNDIQQTNGDYHGAKESQHVSIL
jgi:hypothetical protein